MQPESSVTERAAGAAATSAQAAAAALRAVFAAPFLRKLDRLRLVVRRSLSTRPGNTPMPRGAQGSGIELESYKAYGPGDDLRHLDWSAYGRLDQLLIKTFRAEREAPLHVFIDVSASMAAPATDGKFAFSLGLAASLAYISLRHHDPVRVIAVGIDGPSRHLSSPFFRHRNAVPHLREFLLQLQPHGSAAFADGISAALRAHRSTGVAVVLSDFLMEPLAYESALQELVARRFTVAALRVIGPGERDPSSLFRRGRLTDVETGRQRYITLTQDSLARYQQALTAHLSRLQAFCNRCEIVYGAADTAAGIERSLFEELPRLGLVRR